MLTQDQENALLELEKFYNSSYPTQISLTGGAGVGKSFLLARFLDEFAMPSKVALIAPTHKAKGVIDQFVAEQGLIIDTHTISSFLGLRPQVNYKGRRYFGLPTERKQGTSHVKAHNERRGSNLISLSHEFGTTTSLPQDKAVGSIKKKSKKGTPYLVVVDEASMIKDFEYYLLLYCAKQLKFKILWCGDEYQLPPIQKHKPVNKSKPFRDENVTKLELREVVRNKGEILELCTAVRENLREGKLEVPEYSYELRTFGNLTTKVHDKLKRGKDTQIIAWLNRTVDFYNDDVRELLFGEKAEEYPVFVKDRIITNTSYPIGDNDTIPTGTTLTVTNLFCIINSSLPTNDTLHYYNVLKDKLDIKEEILPDLHWNVIEVFYDGKYVNLYYLEEKDKTKWKDFLKQLRLDLNKYAKDNDNVKGIKSLMKTAWNYYYKLADLEFSFSYGYAITADKSQGSTYEVVFVDAKDILRVKNESTLKRFYVAISRTKDELFIN